MSIKKTSFHLWSCGLVLVPVLVLSGCFETAIKSSESENGKGKEIKNLVSPEESSSKKSADSKAASLKSDEKNPTSESKKESASKKLDSTKTSAKQEKDESKLSAIDQKVAQLPPVGSEIARNPMKENDHEVDLIDQALKRLSAKDAEDLTEPRPIPTPDSFPPEDGWVRLLKGKPLWIDKKNHRVIADGFVCQTEAPLEMLAFPYDRGKHHEAVAAIFCDSKSMHAALLAVGARPGRPVQLEEKYKAAFGTTVKILFQYKDKAGKIRTEDAKSWVREFESKKVLSTDWVFAGSMIFVDPDTKESHYMADNGEMICTSNFITSMLDLPVESSQKNNDLYYQANPEKVPPKETKIRMILVPDLKTVPAVEKRLNAEGEKNKAKKGVEKTSEETLKNDSCP